MSFLLFRLLRITPKYPADSDDGFSLFAAELCDKNNYFMPSRVSHLGMKASEREPMRRISVSPSSRIIGEQLFGLLMISVVGVLIYIDERREEFRRYVISYYILIIVWRTICEMSWMMGRGEEKDYGNYIVF